MSYVLCSVKDCTHHDGEGCTLETVEISKPILQVKLGFKEPDEKIRKCGGAPYIAPDIAACFDYEPIFPDY